MQDHNQLKIKNLKSHIVKSISGTIILRGANVFFNMLTTIVLARALGAKGYGIYSYAMVILQFLVVFSSLGLPLFIVKETAINKEKEHWDLIKGIYLWSTKLSLGSSIFLAIIVGSVVFVFQQYFGEIICVTLLIGLLILPLNTLLRMQEALLRGLSYVVHAQLPMRLVRAGLFPLLIVGYMLIENNFSPYTAMALCVFTFGVGLVFSLFLIKKMVNFQDMLPKFKTKVWMSSLWFFYFIEIADTIYDQVDMFLLGTIKGPEYVGIYRIAHRLSFIIALATMSINVALSPTIAGLYAKKEKELLQQIVTKRTRMLFLLVAPFAFTFIFWGGPIISYTFGPGFVPAKNPLAILMNTQLIVVAIGPVRDLLNLTGFEQVTAKGLSFSVVFIIVLNLLLIPRWGYIGAATAAGINMLVMELFFLMKTIQLTGINPTILGRLSFFLGK